MRFTAGCLILIVLLGASKAAVEVKFARMSDEMQKEARHSLLVAQLIYTNYNDIANYIAKEFDKKHGGTWYCVVGSFGCHLPSNSNVCFYDGSKYTLLFKP